MSDASRRALPLLALLSASPRAASAQEPVWRVEETPPDDVRASMLRDADARSLAALRAWRARWRMFAGVGVEFVNVGGVAFGIQRGRRDGPFAASIALGVRRELVAWLDLDLRASVEFPVSWNIDSYDASMCPPADQPIVSGDRRDGALATLAATLRARPFGTRVPFFVVAGVRATAAFVSADTRRYVCHTPGTDPATDRPGTTARPLHAAVWLAPTGGLGVRFGERERFEIDLMGWSSPQLGADGGGAAVTFAVVLF